MIRILLIVLMIVQPVLACKVLPCPTCTLPSTTTTIATTTTVTTTSSSTSTTPTTLAAGTFYIDNSCANNGNGTTATCAASPGGAGPWNALDNMVCGTFVAPDSTVQIRSHGGTTRSQRYLHRWHSLENAQCAGTLGHPLTIENYPGDAVLMEGTADIHANTWTDRGNGQWECTSGTNCGPPGSDQVYFAAWYTKASISGGAEQRITLVNQKLATCAGAGLAANQMGILNTTAGNLCVRLADDSSPITTDYFDVPRDTDWFEGINGVVQHYVTLQQHPSGGSWTIQRFRNHILTLSDSNTIGWVLNGLTTGWVYDRCIDTSGVGQPDLTVINCNVPYCGQEGIRPDSITGGTTLIQNNDVGHTQDASVFRKCSNAIGGCRKSQDNGTPIRMADCHGVTTRGNTIHDAGGNGAGGLGGRTRGLDLEGSGSDNLIENNYLYNLYSIEDHGDNQSASGAINFSGASFGNNTWSNNVLRNNRMENVEICFRFEADIDTPTQTGNLFENNTCVDAKYAAVEVNGAGQFISSPAFTWLNNIFANFTIAPFRSLIHIPVGHGTAWSAASFTYGQYYSQLQLSSATLITVGASTATANNTSVQTFDANSHYGDPVLNLTGSPPTLKITNTGGAYGVGFAISPAFPDFEGDVRPQTQGWDIGADEAIGTTNTSTTTSTVTSTSTVTTTSTTSSTGAVTTTSTSTSTTTLVTPAQVLEAGGFIAPSTSTATRAGIAGAGWSTDTDLKSEQLIAANGIVGALRVVAQVDPAGTASWTATLLKNEALTGLTCTISAGSTACHDTTTAHNVTFAPGDRAGVRLTPANTPASGAVQVSTLFQPTTTDETIWPSSLGTDISASAAYEAPLNTRNIGSTREAVAPTAGTIKSLYAWTSSTVATGASRIFTVQQNGVDTSLSCTVVQGTNTCTDTNIVHAITVAAGDQIRTAVTFTGTPLGQPLASGVIFVPTATGTYIAGMGLLQAPPTTATDQFTPVNGALIGTSLTTENLLAQSIAQAETLKNIYVKLAGNTGASSVLAVTLRKNGSSTALTCSMTNAATCNLTTNVTAANDDTLGTLWHHTGSAGTSQEAAVSYSATFTGTFP